MSQYRDCRLLLPLLAAVSLAACGGGGSSGSGSTTSAPPGGGGSTPPPTPSQHTDITTYKFDLGRSGQNLTESVLTTANVNSSGFGLLRQLRVDGNVDAQPLYLSGLTLQGATHNVVYVATENDSVYAYDADSGTQLWHVSLLAAGEAPSQPMGCTQIIPTIGVTATPVIDRNAGAHGTLFVEAMSVDGSGNYYHRLHALDVTSGGELLNGPVTISANSPTQSGMIAFVPAQYAERAALLLSQGNIYLSYTSHCDMPPYSGWIMAYSEQNLTQAAVLNAAPNSGGGGPAIWMAGGGPAADASGNVYLLTANGGFETTLTSGGFPSGADYGNSFLKLNGSTLAVEDYFTMANEVAESAVDEDLGSGGIMLLPGVSASGTTVNLAVGAGKDTNLYVVNCASLGKFSASGNHIWQELDGVLSPGIWSTPAYFNHTVYFGPNSGSMRAFTIAPNGKLTAAGATVTTFVYPGALPAVSANGTSNAIVWALENSDPAVLHAYDSSLTHELYNSAQAANGRDQFGAGNKFIAPAIADGKVFVGTTNSVAVFGLL